jgi:hypothetical protein
MPVNPPNVSVVIAAFNSSARLRCAVVSALRQTHQDLEVVVVGDACTDDTEDVLQAIGDSRVRWENLPSNWGEQSAPSNRGIELASGRFVFFLNQDDLWLDDHIESSLELLESGSLDVVWSPFVVLPPGHRPNDPEAVAPTLQGVSPAHPQFDPRTFIPASCAGWRTESLRRIGGWRSAGEVRVSPSQDLLWRASCDGLHVVGKASPTVLVLWSGDRPGSYLPSYRAQDNEHWLELLLTAPEVVRAEVGRIATTAPGAPERTWSARLRRPARLRRLAGFLQARLAVRIGLHPDAIEYAIRYRRSGGFINTIRAMNDLDHRDFRSHGH